MPQSENLDPETKMSLLMTIANMMGNITVTREKTKERITVSFTAWR